ncbi:MAG: hypothetical protein EZS28_038455 [Streblomastix strix]|uniref:Uncharacterized protein n=1 Tax=Streblomastix strix TaxID=222440 RepID=A0A5J4U6R4_9EUKA|nr:MAG: hypothetical protein EZS28_038455 [Streblomastix strix]
MSISSDANPSLKLRQELSNYKTAPLITPNWNLIVKNFFHKFKFPEQIERSLRFLEEADLMRNDEILKLTGNIMFLMMKKGRFQNSAEAHVDQSLFFNSYKHQPLKSISHIQKARELFPSWTNKYICFNMIKQIDSGSSLPNGQQGSKSILDDNQPSNVSTFQTQQILQLAQKQYELAKGHSIRMWALLQRRSIDVERVQFHVTKAMKFGRESSDYLNQILELNPMNSAAKIYVWKPNGVEMSIPELYYRINYNEAHQYNFADDLYNTTTDVLKATKDYQFWHQNVIPWLNPILTGDECQLIEKIRVDYITPVQILNYVQDAQNQLLFQTKN